MESHTLHMISMKALLLAVLAMTATACGIRINDEDDESADAEADSDGDEKDDAKNELVLMIDGAYAANLSSTDVTCERMVDGLVQALHFVMPQGTPDAGLAIDLRVVRESQDGASITTTNSGIGYYFDFSLHAPNGAWYLMTSSGGGNGKRPAYGAVTISKESAYKTAGSLWIQDLPSMASDGSEAANMLSVRGSFTCESWD